MSIQSSSGWRRKEYRGGIVVLALERSSAQWWVLTLGFMGLPGDRGDNPPLRSRPSRAQCLCPLCALNSQFLCAPNTSYVDTQMLRCLGAVDPRWMLKSNSAFGHRWELFILPASSLPQLMSR